MGQHDGKINSLNWSESGLGEFLASAGQDGAVKVWQFNQNKWSMVLDHRGKTPSRSVVFHPGKSLLLIAGFSDGSFHLLEYN